jgi:hypothetical protein
MKVFPQKAFIINAKVYSTYVPWIVLGLVIELYP